MKKEDGNQVEYCDRIINCKNCGVSFTFSASEQDFYAKKKFRDPIRCSTCRKLTQKVIKGWAVWTRTNGVIFKTFSEVSEEDAITTYLGIMQAKSWGMFPEDRVIKVDVVFNEPRHGMVKTAEGEGHGKV